MRKIKLPSGESVCFDDKFYSELIKENWWIIKTSAKVYAFDGRRYMHRVIYELATGKKLPPRGRIRHLDGNGLNNQIKNLRHQPATSSIPGVYRKGKNWAAYYYCDKEHRNIYVGCFTDKNLAHKKALAAKKKRI